MDNFNTLFKNTEKKSVDDYTIKFGKYKNQTFKTVYEDKSYVKFLLDTLDSEKNSVLLNYFREKIECDFCDSKLEETKKRLKVSCV